MQLSDKPRQVECTAVIQKCTKLLCCCISPPACLLLKCRKEFLRNIARRIPCITPSPPAAAAVPKRRLLLGLLPGQAAAAAARCKGTAVPPPAGALLGRGWRRRGASARCYTDVLLHFLLPRHHPAHPAHHPLCHTIRLSQNHLS